MRLLVVSHSCAATINQQIYAEIERNSGWQITLVVPEQWNDEFGNTLKAERWPDFQGSLVPVHVRRSGSIILHSYQLNWERFLSDHQFEAIYVNHEPYALATAQIVWANRRSIRVPIGFYSCQNIAKKYPVPFRWLEQMVYRNCTFAFPITGSVAGVLREKGFRGNLAICPLPLDPARYRPVSETDTRASLSGDANEALIGYVGRVIEAKGLATLARALGFIKDLTWKLVILGTGDFDAKFDAMLQEEGVSTRVIKLGYIPHEDAPRYLAAFDMLVLPSETQKNWKEQYGRVITEALACGTPVIGSSSGEIPNLVNSSGGGLVFEERKPEDLARCLRKLITNPELRGSYAGAGRRWAIKNVSLGSVAERMSETLEAALCVNK